MVEIKYVILLKVIVSFIELFNRKSFLVVVLMIIEMVVVFVNNVLMFLIFDFNDDMIVRWVGLKNMLFL